MPIFKPRCPHCQKEIRINDSVIEFEKLNILHETCYRVILECRYQEAWRREIDFLKQVNNWLTGSRDQLKSGNSLSLKFYKFLGPFDRTIILLNRVTDACKALNMLQRDRLKKSLKKSFKKMNSLANCYTQFLKQGIDSKIEQDRFTEENKEVLEDLKKNWIKLANNLMNVHNILKSCEKSQDVGMPYSILTKLQGQPADKVLEHTSSCEDIKIFQALGTTLSTIHQIEAPWVGPILAESAAPRHINWWQYLSSMLKLFASKSQLSYDKERAIQYLRQAISSMTGPTRLALVHNDYAFHNILLRQLMNSWQVSGILDVEWAFYGDAEWDLACFYWYLRQDYGQYHQIFENFRSGYYSSCAEPPVLQFEKMKVYMLLRMLALSQDYPGFGGDFNGVLQWQTW